MLETLGHFLTNFAAACKLAPGNGGISDDILPTWYKYLSADNATGKCMPVFLFPDDLGKIALAVVEILLRIAAYIAVGYVIYGGFQYLISQGEADKIAGARKTILNAIIGLAIAMLATGIVAFIGGQLK